jgi:hypothetical protein
MATQTTTCDRADHLHLSLDESRTCTAPVAKALTEYDKARDDYAAILREARALSHRITAAVQADVTESMPGIHWGHVGDIARVRDLLREVNDIMFSEGEYE